MTTMIDNTVTVFECMLGAVLSDADGYIFKATDGRVFEFYHEQDCCEFVSIYDICGDLSDLIGLPLLVAEEVTCDEPSGVNCNDSYTWTFYKFATVKGSVTIRWLGESNGYYSESVDFREIKPNHNGGRDDNV
jgi:hypothetical protein